MRDDDNDRSDDEEGQSRMDFSVNQQARDRQQRREAFDAAQGTRCLLNAFVSFINLLTLYINITHWCHKLTSHS